LPERPRRLRKVILVLAPFIALLAVACVVLAVAGGPRPLERPSENNARCPLCEHNFQISRDYRHSFRHHAVLCPYCGQRQDAGTAQRLYDDYFYTHLVGPAEPVPAIEPP
jgi:hypothetical protein